MNYQVRENGRYEVVRTRYDEDRAEIPYRILVFKRDRYRCKFCGSNSRLEIDHIVPWSAGGSDDLDNLRTLCHTCNTDRSNFKVIDDEFRHIPYGDECVYCESNLLLGRPELVPIYCTRCYKKAPGISFNQQPYQRTVFSVEDELETAQQLARREIADIHKAEESAVRRATGEALFNDFNREKDAFERF